jgi:hypothetical protein
MLWAESNLRGNHTPMKNRLPHTVVVRAPGLLPMLYSPPELAEELHIRAYIVREWLKKGLPHHRDAAHHVWLNGREVAAWVEATRYARPRQPLQTDEAFCVKCNRPVKLANPAQMPRGKHLLLSGTCPECGTSIHRGTRHD